MPAPTSKIGCRFRPILGCCGKKTSWNLFTSAGGLDLWIGTIDLPGARGPYSQLAKRATRVELSSSTIAVVGRDDLIAMKRFAARPRDLDDIAALTRAELPEPGG